MPNPITEGYTPIADEQGLSSHDEPIVIDNGPIELDFGGENGVQNVAGSWRRVKATRLQHLLVLQMHGNNIDLFLDKDVDRGQPLVVQLGTQTNPSVASMSFAWQQNDPHRAVVMNPVDVSFDRTDGRKLKPSGGAQLRISKITNGTNFEIDFRTSTGFRSDRVSAILY